MRRIKSVRKIRVGEFWFNRHRKHPAYILHIKNDDYKSAVITHAKQSQKGKNIKLALNPKPNENSQAYLVPKSYSDNATAFNHKLKKWRFSEHDKRRIKRFKKKIKKKAKKSR